MIRIKKSTLVYYIIIIVLWLSCGDKEPPLVEITNPADGDYVNGTVLVTAEAIDNKTVDSVKIYIDDSRVAAFAKPYAYYIWNTDSLPHNSVHSINAISYDHAENIGISDTVFVTIQYYGTLKWRYLVDSITGARDISSPAIGADGTIYFGATCNYLIIPPPGFLFALNPDGTLKWACSTIEWNSAPAISSEGTIYVGNCTGSYLGGFLHAIDAFGTEKWCYYTSSPVVSAPAVARNGIIYFGALDSCLYALNSDGTLIWRFKTGNSVRSSTSIGLDGVIYFGSDDTYLYALNPDSTLKWRYQTNSAVQTSPAISANGEIYFGSNDGYLYALNPEGTLKWQYQTNGASSPVISSDGTIYCGSQDYYLYALNSNGSLKWRFKTGNVISTSPAIATDGTIYFGSNDGYLYALNPGGTLKWQYQTNGIVQSSPTIAADGTVYFGSEDGYLYAVYGSQPLAITSWPKFQHDLKNTGRVGGN